MSARPTNFRTLDLNLLKVFDAVMTERNVTRAAEHLAMTQPAVSNALRRLRESTSEELFVPAANGVVPTPHALALWPVVRSALRALQEAIAPKDFDPRRDERVFTLAMADATAALFAPQLAESVDREAARARLRLMGLGTRDPRPMLERGEADVAVGFFPDVRAALAAEGHVAQCRLDRLYTCEYVCVMRRGHPLAADDALSIDAYCAASHLRVSFADRQRGFVDEVLAQLGRDRRVAMTVDQFSLAAPVIGRSDLLTVLPRSYVPATGLASQLVARRLPFELPTIEVGLLWHRRHEHDGGHRWLRASVSEAAAAIARALSGARADALGPRCVDDLAVHSAA